VGLPLFWRLSAGVELSAGTTFGEVPVQKLYYLSGPQALRASEAGQIAGEAFWMARTELGIGLPAVRFIAFGDFGTAGDREDLSLEDPFISVGGGISVLDGLLRADLARGVQGPGPLRWQFLLYLDALL
jgi:outer membrane protein assembly factor BamA